MPDLWSENTSKQVDVSPGSEPKRSLAPARFNTPHWQLSGLLNTNVAFLVCVLVVLAVPMLAMFVKLLGLDPRTPTAENRAMAKLPKLPTSLASLERLPSELDAFINDNFGFRYRMIVANNIIRYRMFGEMTTRQLIQGVDGRVFYGNYDGDGPYSLIERACGIGISRASIETVARDLVTILQRASETVKSKIMLVVVPDASVIYPEDLPPWLRTQCTQATPLLLALMENLPEDVKTRIYYPIDVMSHLKAETDVIPRMNFHWDGYVPHMVARVIAGELLGLQRKTAVPAVPQSKEAELNVLNPGLKLVNRVMVPDFQSAGIDVCLGPACFPELGAIADKIRDLSRISHRTRDQHPQRTLLILSDSFGAAIAGYFAEYFEEVRHLCTNRFDSLSPAELDRVRTWAMREFAPDHVLMLYHDGHLLDLPTWLKRIWPEKPAGERGAG